MWIRLRIAFVRATAALAFTSQVSACQPAAEPESDPGLCEALDNGPDGEAVTIQIENRRDEDIVLSAPCVSSFYTAVGLEGPAQMPLVRVDTFFPDRRDPRTYPAPIFGTWPTMTCGITCEHLRDGVATGCLDNCVATASIRLTPGAIYPEVWPGVLLTPGWLPAHCIPDRVPREIAPPPIEGGCEVQLPASEGSYVARAREEIPDPLHAADYDCEPNADGWCYPSGDAPAGYAYAHTIFEYPAASVRIVFE